MARTALETAENEWEDEAPASLPASSSAAPAAAPSAPVPSVPVMTGTHFHGLDDKGRVIIPAKLRPALTEQFWMMLDENDNVGIYNYDTGLDILEHCERMIAEHPEDEEIAAAVERITGAADLVTAENGYRVPVPEILRFYAELDKEIVTVGVLNHAVMWSREKWEQAQAQRLHSPEIRKAQASMLRAAASGVRKKADPAEREGAERVQREAERDAPINEEAQSQLLATGSDERALDVRGRRASAPAGSGASNGPERRAAAPAGDGKRSPRVLALSQLGR
jgi:MraZ protein